MKIFTMTLAINLRGSVDLYNIANYLEIESDILGLKYKIGDILICKGICKGSCFENQVTLILKTDAKNLNVKIFSNGKLQITGCTSKNDAINVKKILEEKFDGYSYSDSSTNLETDENGILIKRTVNCKTVILFGRDLTLCGDPVRCIGIIKNGVYFINFSEKCYFDKVRKVFISQKNIGKYTYSIYDLNGNKIGVKKLNLLNSKKVFYKNAVEIQETGHLVLGEHVIGKFEYEFSDYHVSNRGSNFVRTPIWTSLGPTNDIEPEIYSLMFTFRTMAEKLNLQFLFKQFIEKGYIVKFDPNNYSGLIWTLKLKNNNGKVVMPLCDCTKKICGCNKITVIFFESGKVICSGIKSENDVPLIKDFVNLNL
jgi:TATA-box binding protein (TBP) (component of TFIID and TFIIIB)